MRTISEDELREQLWASGNGVDPTRLTALADDALRQARHRQRTLRTATALSVALVVAVAGVTASIVATHARRSASVSTTSTTVGQRSPVKLVTPI
jgi:ABC-type lipoprotein release transport system permease subunit